MNADVSPKRRPRPALSRRSQHPARDRQAGEARRDGRRARDRAGPRRADDVPRRSRTARSRRRGRRVSRADAPRRARGALERQPRVRRCHEGRRLEAPARGDEARLQPAVQRRRHGRRRQPRDAAFDPAVVRDGAEGGRRAVLRRARDEGVRSRFRARPARRHPDGYSRCLANGVPATPPGRLDARRVHARAETRRTTIGSRRSSRPHSRTGARRFPTPLRSRGLPAGNRRQPRSPRSATRRRRAPRVSLRRSSPGSRSCCEGDDRRTGEDQPRARRRAAQGGRQARGRHGVRADSARGHADARAGRQASRSTGFLPTPS